MACLSLTRREVATCMFVHILLVQRVLIVAYLLMAQHVAVGGWRRVSPKGRHATCRSVCSSRSRSVGTINQPMPPDFDSVYKCIDSKESLCVSSKC